MIKSDAINPSRDLSKDYQSKDTIKSLGESLIEALEKSQVTSD